MTPTVNPPDPPSRVKTNDPCNCGGECGVHTGPCRSRHMHRHPGTRTTMHLEHTADGLRCPYCRLAATRPGAIADSTAAALNRPAGDGDQPDLFDTEPYRAPGARKAGQR